MGAAEWTGYSAGSSTNNGNSSYSSYHHHHSHHHHQYHMPTANSCNTAAAAAVNANPGNSTLTHYAGYEPLSASDHAANYHLPTVLTDMQPFCSSNPNAAVGDFHHTAAGGMIPPQASICSPSHYGSAKAELDSFAGYTSYNNWSNGYQNYQYGSCGMPPQATQYASHHAVASTPVAAPPPPPPTMLLYPQVYSTFNQNQIHLHVHGTDKLEQYLGQPESLTISSLSNASSINHQRSSIEIGIGTSDHEQHSVHSLQDSVSESMGERHSHDSHLEQQAANDGLNEQQQHARDDDTGDMGAVWRPY